MLTDNDLSSGMRHGHPVSGTGVGGSLTAQTINFTQPTTPVTYSSGLPFPWSPPAAHRQSGRLHHRRQQYRHGNNHRQHAYRHRSRKFRHRRQPGRELHLLRRTPGAANRGRHQASQTINFTQPTSPVTYSSGLQITLAATGGASGNPVVFTIDASSTATGSISGSTLTVTSTGNLVIDANQAGNANYSAATQVQRTIVVNTLACAGDKLHPAPALRYLLFGTARFHWSPQGGASENPVVFTLDGSSTGAGTITGSTLTVTSVGSFVIDANQAGNSTYSAAPQVQRTVVVNQAPQAINFTQPTSPVTYTSGLQITLSATGGARVVRLSSALIPAALPRACISGAPDCYIRGQFGDRRQPGRKHRLLRGPAGAANDHGQRARAGLQFTQLRHRKASNLAGRRHTHYCNGLWQQLYQRRDAERFRTACRCNGHLQSSYSHAWLRERNFHADGDDAAGAGLVRPNLWPMGTPVPALLFMLPFRRWRRLWRSKLLLLVAGLASLAGACR